ncbi:MAG: DUF11 domain-containing protein [Planctomycetaceae bacterium]|nr:DUF11 domain-containing protein [Planctomycetaceae bacterium]
MSRNRASFWSSLWSKATSWNKRSQTRRQHDRQRKLWVEPLESRQMLANDFGAIGGIVYQDLSDNGFTNDDLRIANATISLYRDSGNGAFDGNDALVSTRTTGNTGEYKFDGLTAGTYFVKRNLPAGYLQKSGTDMATIVVSAQNAAGQVGRMIDSFDSTTQSVTGTSIGVRTDAASMSAPESIGGERDLYANLTSVSGAISLNANAFNQHLLEFTSTALGRGQRIVTWDGVDGSSNLNGSGLGNLDLTNAGANTALRVSIGADIAGGRATFRIYSDAGNMSSATVDIPVTGGGGTVEVLLPFSSFQIASGSGANLTRVGAIQLEITSDTAVDGQISAIAAVGPNVQSQNFGLYKPMSLGNRVFNDVNNNGLLDVGESGIDGVALNLFVDTDKSGTLTQNDTPAGNTTTSGGGFYRFDNLLPNAYLVQIAQGNFNGVLTNYQSSTGNQPTPGDNNVDHDDNGDPVTNAGVVAAAVLLTGEAESIADGDNDPNSNLTVDFGVYVPLIDVELDKSVSAAVANPGDTLTYTVFIRNNGPLAATGTTVVDSLPAGVTYQSSTTTQGTVTVGAGGQLTYNIGNMAVLGTATITIVTKINNSASGVLTNTAVVSVNERETRLDNNQDSVPTTVNKLIDVAIDKTGTPDVVRFNDVETYTLTITNNGPSEATGVTVTDTLPTGLTFTSATTGQGTFQANGNIVTFAVGNLAAGASTQITITTRVVATLQSVLTNVAVVAANEVETTYVNNRDEYPITVLPPPQAPISSVGGFVYVDTDNDGVFDPAETPIAGVSVRLLGTDSTGAAVDQTVQTQADGSYLFNNLDGGMYSIIETQPGAYTDGLDTLGTNAAGTNAQEDRFRNVNLGDGTLAINGINYNFGERRRATVINKFSFLGSS